MEKTFLRDEKEINFGKYVKGQEISVGDILHISLGCGLCWMMDWQWEDMPKYA